MALLVILIAVGFLKMHAGFACVPFCVTEVCIAFSELCFRPIGACESCVHMVINFCILEKKVEALSSHES